jgi:GNAT superfamily N-acetyltransferase
MASGSVIREIQPGEGALVADVLHELRPHRHPDGIPALVDAQRAEGYRVVASFVDDLVVAAAGFRLSSNLALGRAIYIDDLVTLPRARGAGHARSLLEWIVTEAIRLGCSYVHLDSATHRHAAHRLYLTGGYDITAFHFVRST